MTIGLGRYGALEASPGRWLVHKADGSDFYTVFPERRVCNCPAWQFGTRNTSLHSID